MAFLVEDCSGLESANSMATVVEFNEYFEDRGNADAVALTDIKKQSLLILGADYLANVFSWSGDKYVNDQSMPFPRVIDTEKLCTPANIKYAQIELALIANGGDLLSDVGQRVISEQVSSIKVTYSEYSDEQTKYTAVYSLVKPYLENNSSVSHKVIRS